MILQFLAGVILGVVLLLAHGLTRIDSQRDAGPAATLAQTSPRR